VRSPLKHRWSVAHNYLAGVTAGDWWRLLRENRFAVDRVYWHRAAFITLSSLMNSCYRQVERVRFTAAVADTSIAGPPLFILGHWRSGTTHLHNLLALDTRHFAFANTYQAVNPHTFLSSERINTRLFSRLVPNKRPMDNMALSFAAPQEDEFAHLLATFRSPYLGATFSRRQGHYERYLTFRGVPQDEIDEWKAAFLWFARKLTLKYAKPLVWKSPPHTARVRLLLEMFPDARFVHIHREPYTVFQSFQHYFDTAMWYTYLQRPEPDRDNERIISRYALMYDVFFDERRLIPSGRYFEMCFEDLERDPIGHLRALYDALGLSGFATLEPDVARYLGTIKSYEKNKFPNLPAGLRSQIAAAWARSFQEWGYPC
jgi:omega-hydroxy-beta-dihydromenaquinone-9 sulfotransferase